MRRLTERERLDRTLSEQQWLSQVIRIAKMNGFLVCHFRPGMFASGKWVTPLDGDAGFPDLIMLRGHRQIVVEIKREVHSPVTPEQRRWLDAFITAGVESYVWRPSDRDFVVKTLAREARGGLA